jgi:hypothetical protein
MRWGFSKNFQLLRVVSVKSFNYQRVTLHVTPTLQMDSPPFRLCMNASQRAHTWYMVFEQWTIYHVNIHNFRWLRSLTGTKHEQYIIYIFSGHSLRCTSHKLQPKYTKGIVTVVNKKRTDKKRKYRLYHELIQAALFTGAPIFQAPGSTRGPHQPISHSRSNYMRDMSLQMAVSSPFNYTEGLVYAKLRREV